MAVIEGVGDEVTLLFGSLLILLVLLLAWISTRTPDPALSQTGPDSVSETRSTTTDTPTSSTSSDSSTEAPPLATVTGDKRGEGVRSRGEDNRNSLVLRLKFLNDTEQMATVTPQDTVGHIKRTYFAGQEQRVRLIYQGQLLQDDAATVSALNLPHNCVLHCHISQHASGRAGAGPVAGPGEQVAVAINVGSLMVPLLVLMLAVLWYCQIQYRQFFTAPATATLAGLTVLLSLVAFGVYRR